MKKLGLIALLVLSSVMSFAKDVILDVRTAEEYAIDHSKQAINIDVLQEADFNEKILKMDMADRYRIYCKSGRRAAHAIEIMRDLGFTDLENLGSLEEAKKILGE